MYLRQNKSQKWHETPDTTRMEIVLVEFTFLRQPKMRLLRSDSNHDGR